MNYLNNNTTIPSKSESSADLGVEGLETASKVKKSPRILSNDEILVAIAKYNNGAFIKEICSEFGCHRGYLAKLIKSRGVKVARRSRLSRETIVQILYLHAEGLSSRQIEAKIGVGYKTAQKIIRDVKTC